MLRRFVKRINLNFKHSSSDRRGTEAYRSYNHKLVKLFSNVNPFKKINKEEFINQAPSTGSKK